MKRTEYKIEDLIKKDPKGDQGEKIKKNSKEEELKSKGYTRNEDGEYVFNKKDQDVVDGVDEGKEHRKRKMVTKNYENIEDVNEEDIIEFIEEGQSDEADFLKDQENDFENQDILGNAIKETRREIEKLRKNLPEISQKEKEMMLKDFPRLLKALVNKKRFEKEDVSEKAALELVKEVMDNFPNEYVKLIHEQYIPKVQEYNWKKEKFRGEDYFVSYYPNEENPIIKYIHKNPDEKTDIFLARTKKKTKNKKGEASFSIMKTEKGKGPYLVFLGH